jgi:hypothetical protein
VDSEFPHYLSTCRQAKKSRKEPKSQQVFCDLPDVYILALDTPLSVIHSFQSTKGRIPHLSYLIINNDYLYYRETFPMPQSWDAFEIPPKLSYFILKKQVSVLKPNFPLAQLHELCLLGHSYMVDDCLQKLHNFPKLAKLHIMLSGSQHHPHPIVWHSNLCKLQVDIDVDDVVALFDSLSLPSLVTLSCLCSGRAIWP